MRVLVLADPVPFELPGGLRSQVRASVDALNLLHAEGIEAALGDPAAGVLPACDLVHVIGGAGANGALEAALASGAPLVFSPRLSAAWNRSNGSRARVADRVQGNRSGWDLDTGYARLRRALQRAGLVVALCEAERKALCEAFMLEPKKLRVVPNGVAPRFFDASPVLFRERARMCGCFALMVGQVSPYANQLGVARTLAGLALPLVVIGAARERDTLYLRQLRAMRNVTCLGALEHDDPMLASAYSAASLLVVGGRSSGWPMAVPEALAAGTPVVTSGACALAGAELGLRRAGWGDPAALIGAVSDLLERPPARDAVSALVRPLTWRSVASQLAACYREVLARAS
jgi:glycosyltransferase involved in cell wall biosynthesis